LDGVTDKVAANASPILLLRPRANFLPDTVRRARANPSFVVSIIVTALAGFGAVLAFGHKFVNAVVIVATIGIATAAGVLLLYGWLFAMLLGSRWSLFPDRLLLTRPGANELEIPRSAIAQVRLVTVTGLGMQDPIYLFVDRSGQLLFWTVARRWMEDDLRRLWDLLGVRPIPAQDGIHPYETLPYDHRY
jgi:hypothetical protein